jgi:hypothetical protein
LGPGQGQQQIQRWPRGWLLLEGAGQQDLVFGSGEQRPDATRAVAQADAKDRAGLRFQDGGDMAGASIGQAGHGGFGKVGCIEQDQVHDHARGEARRRLARRLAFFGFGGTVARAGFDLLTQHPMNQTVARTQLMLGYLVQLREQIRRDGNRGLRHAFGSLVTSCNVHLPSPAFAIHPGC